MGAELSKVNGVTEMFYVGETPWHRDGIRWDHAPTFAEGMEVVGYEVEKLQTYLRRVTPDGDEYFQRSEKAFSIVRKDTGRELGSVGASYEPVQNAEAFAPMEPLLDSGVLGLATGGVLKGGEDAWLLGRFDMERFGPVVKEVFADEVAPYVLFSNNHSGRRGVTVAETPIRVVCWNTLKLAEHSFRTGRAVEVAHRGNARVRIVEAAQELFAGIIERYETIAGDYRALKHRVLTEEEFTSSVLDILSPRPQDNRAWNPEARMAATVIERAEARRGQIRLLWENGIGHTGDHSAWEALNAMTQALDHREDLFPTRAGVYRTASLLGGRLRQLKEASTNALVALALQA